MFLKKSSFRRSLPLAAAFLLTATACDPKSGTGDGDGDDDNRTEEDTIIMYSWWINPGEVEALDALLAVHADANPDVTVINAVSENPNTAADELAERLEEGNPPDTFQVGLGQVIARHVELNGVDDASSQLEPLDDLEVDFSAYPEEVLESVSSGGHVYAIPLNIHRLNVLYYNKHVLNDHNLTVPTSLAELETACETLAQAGVTCLSVGGLNRWPLGLWWNSAMIPAVGDAQWFNDFYQGRADPNDQRIVDAAETLVRLSQYMPPNELDLDWVDSGTLAAQGDVAFTIMGDWMKGYLAAVGSEPGVDFGSVAFPGSGDKFVFHGDSFPLPYGAPSTNAARGLLETMAQAEAQTKFNQIKGSIPARTDISADLFDELTAETMNDFRTVDKVLSNVGQAPGWNPNDAVYEAIEAGDPQILVNWIKNNYDSLKR